MPAPYSNDLRSRVIIKVEDGLTLQEAADTFNLGIATIGRWWRKYKSEGSYEAKSGYQKGHSHKVTDLNSFRDFVKKNPSLTCNEIALRLGNMCQTTAYSYLKKINFTRKKKFSLPGTSRKLAR